tara:strand:- start:23 stop:172 length:150 start_codon:yes stop_codon:yes gene_type:complete
MSKAINPYVEVYASPKIVEQISKYLKLNKIVLDIFNKNHSNGLKNMRWS